MIHILRAAACYACFTPHDSGADKNYTERFMVVKGYIKEKILHIDLKGEMDECSAQDARSKCDRLIEDNLSAKKIVINLSEVAFMDSTGIGFLIGRYKKASRLSLPLYIEKPNFAADKILNLSGIYSLIPRID